MQTIADKLRLQRHTVVHILMAVYDFVAVVFSYFLALWLRYDLHYSRIPLFYLKYIAILLPTYALLVVIVFHFAKLYKSVWEYASYTELLNLIAATLVTCPIMALATVAVGHPFPILYYVLGFILQFLFTLAIRFIYRFITLLRKLRENTGTSEKRVMLIGAGDAGTALLDDINVKRETGEKVVCLIDDDPDKWDRYIMNIPVVGGRNEIMAAVKDYNIDKIYLAMPSASARDKRDILMLCQQTDCELKSVSFRGNLVNNRVTTSSLHHVRIEELLGREEVKVDNHEILQSLEGKRVMVTGGGGSIGSEVCRQIARQAPKSLIIFDVYENNAYEIQQELKRELPNLNMHVVIGSVRDSERMKQVFQLYKPNIVIHAAAHKHVPLMEDSPCEAIKNNAIGTYKTAYAAMANGCDRFILISTDKAVNPTNIMGASKRLCEMIVQTFDKMVKAGTPEKLPFLYTHAGFEKDELQKLPEDIKTEFVAVRFGNVLGSNGSVIPLFKKQIMEGGPVTVTHPDIIRYFMTIPEAVSLILQASAYAKGGEIFVLDMGEPVKIDDLAKNLIRLYGHTPNEDILIQYTGLRPGEKLFEEKLMDEEGLETTQNELIHIGKPIELNEQAFLEDLKDLMCLAYKNDEEAVLNKVQDMVPTYTPT